MSEHEGPPVSKGWEMFMKLKVKFLFKMKLVVLN